MAVRYAQREQTKLVNRVKKLLAQGKSLNAACTQVSEREGGLPATNTLANWVRAAGLPESAPPADETPAPTKPRRRTRAAGKPTDEPAPAAEIAEAIVADDVVESSLADDVLAESTEPAPETTAEPTAELVRVRPAGTALDATGGIDDLLDENHRLRTALNEANREIRAMRDLLVVYASR
ncbi:hypothetical protein [Nocardia jinanensis]|uniref:Uncharacterized protein n=1 Tax=Nocardia jinanensis TaxID=382504 RepID=A0A917VNN7_9NOCA|nr:hypothetical protein [Nocardia jinanensis]GGK99166.1 hypothetical protein GCM10011588_12270 [Nocardia jinanensis]